MQRYQTFQVSVLKRRLTFGYSVTFAGMEQQVLLDELSQFAARFWKAVNGATVFAFHGPMGAGKTTLITALCSYKGVLEPMSSPTFSIINEYTFFEGDKEKVIYHIDLYRLKDFDEVIQAGVEDCINSGHICLVEWPEKAPDLFDERTVHVFIEPESDTARRVKVEKAIFQR